MRAFRVKPKPTLARRRRRIAMALISASVCALATAQGPIASAQTISPAADVITVASQSTDGSGAVKPVPAVTLDRFLGQWYEIARIPAWFQNRCVTRKGQPDQSVGRARVLDPATNARLQVSFLSLLGWRPFWGDYWVIGLDPDDRWLVVGDPRRQYGWILSRNPVMEPALLEAAFQTLERNGYVRARFVFTPQS